MIRRHDRREQALARQEARDKRTDAQQLATLQARGYGHCKEAVRLTKKVNKSSDSRGRQGGAKL